MQSANNTLSAFQPISEAAPTAADLLQTDKLIETLKKNGCFESAEETSKRIEVLRALISLVKKWEMSMSEGMEGYEPSAKLLTFGSFRLGVHSSGGDIDTLLVVPRHIKRSDFFNTFRQLLEQDVNVKGLVAVQDAFVPIITLTYSGVELDILFARLDLKVIPVKLDLSDDGLLKNLDEKCVRSLNGCRVAEALLKIVPNHKSFALALRAVKLWAKRHGLSSNSMGFFGGITWAILVAKTCQLYPSATASKIVQKVYYVFSNWQWSSACPVTLTQLPDSNKVWNPRQNHADRFHLMPILTPAYPQQNTTFNVSQSSAAVIKEALNEASEMCKKIEEGQADWTDLLEEVNFFSRYKHFIALKMAAGSEEEKDRFSGFLESRLRQLVMALERNRTIKLAHLCTTGFQPKENPQGKCVYFVGLEFADHVKTLDLTRDTDRFKLNLESQGKKAKVPSVEIDITYIKQSGLISLVSSKDLRRGRFVKTCGAANKKRKMVESEEKPAKRPLQVRN